MIQDPTRLSSEQVEHFKKIALRNIPLIGIFIGTSFSTLLRRGLHIAPEVGFTFLVSLAIFMAVIAILAFGPRHSTLGWLAGRLVASFLLAIPIGVFEIIKIGSMDGVFTGYLASIPIFFVLMVLFVPRNPADDPFLIRSWIDKWIGWRS